jgi:RND family efflux transporter MFP subunit
MSARGLERTFRQVEKWDALAVALSAALLVGLVACGQEELPPDLPPRAIKWERVSGSVAGQNRVISGIVTAIDETQLSFEVNGTVETVEVDLGDKVERGQVLARLDPEPLELTVRDAEAAVAEARALREHARATLSRYLEAAAAVARQEIDRARAARDSRESQYVAAQARLKLVRRDLRLSVLEAPFRGSISSREVDPAQRVAAGQIVFELDSEESGLRVEVQMPETLIDRVRQGDPAQVRFPSLTDAPADVGDESFPAVVAEVGTRAQAGNSFPVRADLSDPPSGVRPGMTAEVTFTLGRGEGDLAIAEGFMIPIAAVLPEADNAFSVFVFDGETSTLSKRPVQTGGLGENNVFILEGLAEDDIIATAGVTFLKDGQRVTLLDEELVRNAP